MKPKVISKVEIGSVNQAISMTEETLLNLISKLQNGRSIEDETVGGILNHVGDLTRLASVASDAANKLVVRIGYINNAAEIAKLREAAKQ